MSTDVKRADRELVTADVDNPFDVLPAELIGPAAFFATHFAHTKLSVASLCTKVVGWIDEGLTIGDVRRILLRFCEPQVAMQFRFDNELVPAVEAHVWTTLRLRRQLDERQRKIEATLSPNGAAGLVVRVSNAHAMPKEERAPAPPIVRRRATTNRPEPQ